MTVSDFCLHETKTGELVVILDAGYIVCTAWIDIEDLFMLDPQIARKRVMKDEWGTLKITDKDGNRVEIPCHNIYT